MNMTSIRMQMVLIMTNASLWMWVHSSGVSGVVCVCVSGVWVSSTPW
jgi:hypothetical protein